MAWIWNRGQRRPCWDCQCKIWKASAQQLKNWNPILIRFLEELESESPFWPATSNQRHVSKECTDPVRKPRDLGPRGFAFRFSGEWSISLNDFESSACCLQGASFSGKYSYKACRLKSIFICIKGMHWSSTQTSRFRPKRICVQILRRMEYLSKRFWVECLLLAGRKLFRKIFIQGLSAQIHFHLSLLSLFPIEMEMFLRAIQDLSSDRRSARFLLSGIFRVQTKYN